MKASVGPKGFVQWLGFVSKVQGFASAFSWTLVLGLKGVLRKASASEDPGNFCGYMYMFTGTQNSRF